MPNEGIVLTSVLVLFSFNQQYDFFQWTSGITITYSHLKKSTWKAW